MARASPGKTRSKTRPERLGGGAFFVESAFLDGALVERARISRPSDESLPPKDEHEHLKPMVPRGVGEGEQAFIVAGEIEKRREIDFEELLRDGPGTLVIEPPPCIVGEDAPSQLAGRQIVHAPNVAEHLSRGRVFLAPATGAAVERAQPALGLDDRETELIALPFLGEAIGTVLSGGVCEQQAVGYVLAALGGEVLLAKTRLPPELQDDRPDQIVFGLAFIGRLRHWEAVENVTGGGLEGVERVGVKFPPVVQTSDRIAKEIVGEETSLEWGSDSHPLPILWSLRKHRFSWCSVSGMMRLVALNLYLVLRMARLGEVVGGLQLTRPIFCTSGSERVI